MVRYGPASSCVQTGKPSCLARVHARSIWFIPRSIWTRHFDRTTLLHANGLARVKPSVILLPK